MPGQLVTLVRLRTGGTKSRGAAEHGYLVLEDLVVTPQVTYRPARSSANLYRAPDRLMGSGRPLFDPEIVRWDARGVILQGWEIADGGVQYRQVWLVTFQPVESVQTSAQ